MEETSDKEKENNRVDKNTTTE